MRPSVAALFTRPIPLMLLFVHLMPEPDQLVAQSIDDSSLLVNCIVLPVDDVELRYADAAKDGVLGSV